MYFLVESRRFQKQLRRSCDADGALASPANYFQPILLFRIESAQPEVQFLDEARLWNLSEF